MRNKKGNRAGFITGRDESGRASGGASPGSLGGYSFVTTPGFWLAGWVDGGANKRGAVKSSGGMYSWGQGEF